MALCKVQYFVLANCVQLARDPTQASIAFIENIYILSKRNQGLLVPSIIFRKVEYIYKTFKLKSQKFCCYFLIYVGLVLTENNDN